MFPIITDFPGFSSIVMVFSVLPLGGLKDTVIFLVESYALPFPTLLNVEIDNSEYSLC